jgi:chromosomal replication initiator protein
VSDQHDSFGEVWNRVVAELKSDSPQEGPPLTGHQKAWLSLVQPLAITSGFALLAAPTALVQEQIERNLRDTIGAALSRHLGQPVEVAVRIAEPKDEPAPVEEAPSAAPTPVAESVQSRETPDIVGEAPRTGGEQPTSSFDPSPTFEREQAPSTRDWAAYFTDRNTTAPSDSSATLHPKYTFDTFVIGASNRFAHAAARRRRRSAGPRLQPAVHLGRVRTGQDAPAARRRALRPAAVPGMRVKYVSTEEFTNDFINSLRDDRQQAFKRRYRDVDILLVDDIQFIEGREGIQEEFFHTFNTLHNSNKQIVISSDRRRASSPRSKTGCGPASSGA